MKFREISSVCYSLKPLISVNTLLREAVAMYFSSNDCSSFSKSSALLRDTRARKYLITLIDPYNFLSSYPGHLPDPGVSTGAG